MTTSADDIFCGPLILGLKFSVICCKGADDSHEISRFSLLKINVKCELLPIVTNFRRDFKGK